MSATMHPEVAQAAARLAAQAQPMPPGPGRLAFLAKRAELKSKQERKAAETWGAIPMHWRALLALALPDGDPEQIALSPWGSLPLEQREKLGSVGRSLVRDLQHRVGDLRV